MLTDTTNGRTLTAPSSGKIDWSALVSRIERNDARAEEELYRVLCKGIRYYFCRQLGADGLEDRVHETFLTVIQAIQKGEIREPERLIGFVHTVVRRRVAAGIKERVSSRNNENVELSAGVADRRRNPEQDLLVRERTEIVKRLLEQLAERDRDILVRFYVWEQPKEQICEEMELTETQFRLFKSRAIGRIALLSKRKGQSGVLQSFAQRACARSA